MTLHDRLHWPFAPTKRHFGQSVPPERLRIGSDGVVQVLLDGNWPKLLQGLVDFGEVVTTTNNPVASLTQIGRYPNFRICSCGRACGVNGGLAFDFSMWQHVWASRRQTNDGIWRTLAVCGKDNSANHQVLFGAQTDDEQFAQLVHKFSSKKKFRNLNSQPQTGQWNFSRNLPRSKHVELFRQRKQGFIENNKNNFRLIHTASLAELWRNVLSERIWLGITIITAPVIHSALWLPLSLTENHSALTASSENVFFYCQPEKIAELWVVPAQSDSDSQSALEAYDRHDDLLFALGAPPEWKNLWNELLQWLPTA